MNKVLVVGAGASGLVAAIEAAKNGAKVTVIEKNNKAGKKLLATGNGRCNMTNTSMSVHKYRGNNPEFIERVIAKYSTNDIVDYFDGLVLTTRDIGGYVYPYSLQAQTVLDKLISKCMELGVKIALDTECIDINQTEDKRFIVKTPNYTYEADKVIVSTGLVASVNVKGDSVNENSIFALSIAKKTGHRICKVVPALVGLKCKNKYQKIVSGVRWESEISTYIDGRKVFKDVGELQFADYGISGIVVFQNARFASFGLLNKQKVEVVIDMLPHTSKEEFKSMLEKQLSRFKNVSIYDVLTGIFNNKLVSYILANAKINEKCKAINVEDVENLVNIIKEHRLEIVGTRGFEYAQVCAGGIDTNDINDSMESKYIEGLYFTGEALDVDGMCGGYNLHFAFATGIEAGKNV